MAGLLHAIGAIYHRPERDMFDTNLHLHMLDSSVINVWIMTICSQFGAPFGDVNSLNADCWLAIFVYLDLGDLWNFRRVNKRMRTVVDAVVDAGRLRKIDMTSLLFAIYRSYP